MMKKQQTREIKTTSSRLLYFYCRDAKRKKNFFIDKINFLLYCVKFNFIKRNSMVYLKGIIIDNFQTERTLYRIVDYKSKENLTTTENVIIFPKKYTRYVVNRRIGDYISQTIKGELDNGLIESNKQEFNSDIKDKRGEFGNKLTEE